MVDPIAQRLHQNLTPFDAANMVFHFDAKAENALVVQLINRGERAISGLLLGLLDRYPVRGKPLEPRILPQRTAWGKP